MMAVVARKVFSEEEILALLNDWNALSFIENSVDSFWVTLLPADVVADSHEWDFWALQISRKSFGRWAVQTHGGGEQFDKDGKTEYEDIPSERTQAYKDRFRHDLVDAVRIAFQVLPKLHTNGLNAEQFVEWFRKKQEKRAQITSEVKR